MDCCPTYLLFFNNQYWRPFVYPSTVPPFLSTGQTRGHMPQVAWLRPRHQGDACNWGRTHKHRLDNTQAASLVWGVGPQPWFRDATSFDGQPRRGRAMLFAKPITHKNYIIHFNSMANSPMCLGLTNTMEPGSYPSWHPTVPLGHSLGLAVPCSSSWCAMVGPGCERKITRTPLLCHWCLMSNLHPVRVMQYKQVIHPPIGPFSRVFTLPELQSTYWTPLSDWDSTVLDVDLRVWMVQGDLYNISVPVQEDHRRTCDPCQTRIAEGHLSLRLPELVPPLRKSERLL